ncbi:MAG: hypothetical protein MJB14_06815, partial [Spirochaetes bacterium]|nr:hypothetical protein [Spirochaetota bacterium]
MELRKFEIFDSFKKVEYLKEKWDSFSISCKSPIYMSFDWCKTWWKYYGHNKELLIYIFYKKD